MPAAARTTDLAEIARLADRAEIADLFARLANLLDECRHDDAATVFHDDIVGRSPRGELHGLDEMIALLKRSRVEGEHTQHVHGDVLVTVDGDHANATANQLVYFYRDGEPPHRTSGLRAPAPPHEPRRAGDSTTCGSRSPGRGRSDGISSQGRDERRPAGVGDEQGGAVRVLGVADGDGGWVPVEDFYAAVGAV